MATEVSSGLVLNGLSVRHGARLAVEDVSLAVARGEVVALLGPAEAGKTSLLMSLAGFLPAHAGSVLLNGRDIGGLPARRRDAGVVFDRSPLFPRLTAAENVAFPLRQRRMRRVEVVQRVRGALELFGLSAIADRLPSRMDEGERHRTALARAVAFGPALLLLDEPQDRAARAGLREELQTLRHRVSFPLVAATRDAAVAMAADRIAILHRGRLVESGTPAALYAAPRTRHVATCLGATNFLAATVREVRAGAFTVVCNGIRLAQAAQPGAPRLPLGAPVTLSLRPERIGVLLEDERADNVANATIRTVSCEAGAFVLRAVSPLGELTVRLPIWRAPLTPAAGMPVRLGWAADAATAVAED